MVEAMCPLYRDVRYSECPLMEVPLCWGNCKANTAKRDGYFNLAKVISVATE